MTPVSIVLSPPTISSTVANPSLLPPTQPDAATVTVLSAASVFQKPASQRKYMPLNVVLILLALLLIGEVSYGNLTFMSNRSVATQTDTTATSGIVNGIGATRLTDGESIGISDGSVAFDTNRPDGSLKQQAAMALRAGHTTQAEQLWQQAVAKEHNDAEGLVYLEDQRVLASGTFHVTIVVATMLSGTNVNVGRDDLQGAYVAQKTFNDGTLLGGIGVILLIANGSSENANTPAVARQIVQAAQDDPTIIGVMGWPFSSFVSRSVNVFATARIPVVSPTASSDLLTGVSPYFFRVCPTNKVQGMAGAHYVAHNLHAKHVIVFADPLDPYSSSLSNDFTAQFQADGNTVLTTEYYKIGQASTVVSAMQDALTHTNPVADAFYFSGYANDISTLLSNLPTSGPLATLQVMGGDALYELGSYKPNTHITWNRLHFTSFAYPDVWNMPGYNAQKPVFFTNYQNYFDPTHTHTSSPYGWDRADGDTMLSYDATVTFLMAAKDTGQTQVGISSEWQALTRLNGSHAIQGISGQIALGSDGDPINKAIVILSVSSQDFIQMDNTVEGQFLLPQEPASRLSPVHT